MVQGDKTSITQIDFKPLTPERWSDFEKLFGAKGACGGCWCMYWKVPRSDFERQKGDGNRDVMRALVDEGEIPGILAYEQGEPVGWCAVAPRSHYPGLQRSRVLKPVDDQAVWSITCFFIAKNHRNRGLSIQLLRAAITHVRDHGGTLVEGYPVEPKNEKTPDAFAWTGLATAFLRAGFKEVARRSPTRPVMRFRIE